MTKRVSVVRVKIEFDILLADKSLNGFNAVNTKINMVKDAATAVALDKKIKFHDEVKTIAAGPPIPPTT
jgi:hypothetical protein